MNPGTHNSVGNYVHSVFIYIFKPVGNVIGQIISLSTGFSSFQNKSIHLLAEQNGNMPREEFINQITSNLINAEEFLEFIPLQFESIGSRNSKIQIDGYYYDNLEHCLALFICDFVESDEIETLTNTDAVNLFKKEQNFIVNSMNGFIL